MGFPTMKTSLYISRKLLLRNPVLNQEVLSEFHENLDTLSFGYSTELRYQLWYSLSIVTEYWNSAVHHFSLLPDRGDFFKDFIRRDFVLIGFSSEAMAPLDEFVEV